MRLRMLVSAVRGDELGRAVIDVEMAYGIDGPSQGHFYVDHRTAKLVSSDSAYEHPQPHACFIQSVADDLVNEGG
ncbi:MAG: hypothetical protein AAF913_15755, partial [Pseudomonadota bacterium]